MKTIMQHLRIDCFLTVYLHHCNCFSVQGTVLWSQAYIRNVFSKTNDVVVQVCVDKLNHKLNVLVCYSIYQIKRSKGTLLVS